MLSAVLLWILGSIIFAGTVVTVAIVYAALKIAARTDAIIGECKMDVEERWTHVYCGAGAAKPRRQWRLPHLPGRASI